MGAQLFSGRWQHGKYHILRHKVFVLVVIHVQYTFHSLIIASTLRLTRNVLGIRMDAAVAHVRTVRLANLVIAAFSNNTATLSSFIRLGWLNNHYTDCPQTLWAARYLRTVLDGWQGTHKVYTMCTLHLR
jgi:hypothetical protein